ncbi:Response regulator receiver domain-containing protein [Cnuella takakiae]|uniref:Response regulator receiver domain-containing protein n=1 Tax=Cnuella takakiae TaxID=1302690 RepID=A0A1M4ZBR2_9BACT|nr:response regulator [Cnuella takakiae]SHF15222.1 Response regulator receiver domain-containing protein [Cnuella takakiae]
MLILIVDDNSTELAITDMLLKERLPGVQTLHATNGCEMLNLLDSSSASIGKLPDLILVELYLPNFDGWQAVQNLRDRPTFKELPVAFYSRTKNPKNYLLASRLNTPLFMKGDRLIDHAKSINNLVNWYSGLVTVGDLDNK